jgi:hypothetical protein
VPWEMGRANYLATYRVGMHALVVTAEHYGGMNRDYQGLLETLKRHQCVSVCASAALKLCEAMLERVDRSVRTFQAPNALV